MSGDFAARVVAQARALVGVPFALHGRDARFGVDCVGLAVLAFGRAGHRGVAPLRYGVRAGVARVEGWLREAGFVAVDAAAVGDLVVVRPSAVQMHVMICTGDGFVHAHGGLGRVVEMPGDCGWPVVGCWRAV